MQEIDKELLISVIHFLSAGASDQNADKLPAINIFIGVGEDGLSNLVCLRLLKVSISLVDIGCVQVYHV